MQGNNLKDLIKIELVNRFEGVVIDEIRKNEDARREIRKEIESIYASLEKIQIDIQNSNYELEKSLSKELKKIINEISKHQDNINTQEKILYDKCKEVDRNMHFMGSKIDETLSKVEFDTCFENLKKELKQEKLHRHVENQAIDSKISSLEKKILDFFCSEIESLLSRMRKLENTIENFDEKINLFSVHNEGFVKELACCKKETFIHEKKIENIYTLIDRIKER